MEQIEIGQQSTVLFDGDCGICTYFAGLVNRVDRRDLFEVHPYQRFPEEALRPWRISYADCERKLQVISRTGRVFRGAFAVNYIFYSYFPWKLVVLLIHAIPIFLLLEILGYALVARHRTRLSRWFGLKACLREE
jgi:predicted DCC family thiol-disulfide oxidoreductase YuxK